MPDLSREDLKALGRAVGIEIDEHLLDEVAYNLNGLRDVLANLNPPGVDKIEPLPIIYPPPKDLV